MSSSVPPYCFPSKSKLRRERAAAARTNLVGVIQQSNSLVGVQSQLAMLTASIDNIAALFTSAFYGSSYYYPVDGCSTCPSYETPVAPSTVPADTASACEPLAKQSCSIEDFENHCHGCWEALPATCFCSASQLCNMCSALSGGMRLSKDIGTEVRADSHDTAGQILGADVQRIELYDSCRTLATYSAQSKGLPCDVLEISRDMLPGLLHEARLRDIAVQSFFDKAYAPVVDVSPDITGEAPPLQEEDSDWKFLEQQLESCLSVMKEIIMNMEPVIEKREDVLDDMVETGMNAMLGSLKSDRAKETVSRYLNRLRSTLRCQLANMMP